jgi:membrane protease YdiL (CAAX protease family)
VVTGPDRPGRSRFTIEGRAAPGLFVFGWLGALLGLGAVIVGVLSGGGAGGSIVFVGGMVLLDLGLIAGAGSQAIERRAQGTEAYQGPSPILVLLASIVTVYLAAVVIGTPLAAAGVNLPRPAAELLLVTIHAATYVGITRLLVVGTGALTWRAIGFRGSSREVVTELGWGAVLAGPVILVTGLLSAALVSIFGVVPTSPLPPAGSPGGLLLNLVAGALVAPVGEEILFRGVATTAWVRSLGPRAGIVRGALVFAAVHVLLISAEGFGQAAGMAAVGFLGRLPVALVLGWLFVRRGSIWAPIGLHAAFNGILLVAAENAARLEG